MIKIDLFFYLYENMSATGICFSEVEDICLQLKVCG